jgi:AraC family transcriptional regulator
MINYRLVERSAFEIIGKKTWINGPDNEQFGKFWEKCRAEGLLDAFNRIKQAAGKEAGAQTMGAVLGVSQVEKNPAIREFYYMIAIEAPDSNNINNSDLVDLERYLVPAAQWAVFECRGQVPDSIVSAEIFAFTEWLPNSVYVHALAPEMEVYPAGSNESYCEFWLPVQEK